MIKIALGCLVDGFAGPLSLNERSLTTIRKLTELCRKMTRMGYYVEIWVTKSVVVHPEGKTPLYELMREAILSENIPESHIRITDLPAYNALTDGLTFASYAVLHPMDEYIFVVPNFYLYFLLTYRSMRKYMGDGESWKNISVISACDKAGLRACLLYGTITLITIIAGQNRWLWGQWFKIRAQEKQKREDGFTSTMS